MRKYLSLVIALSLILTAMLSLTAYAEVPITLLYSIPNTNLIEGNNKIGVNQQLITLKFSSAVEKAMVDGISFTDDNGNEPKGGIVKTFDNDVVSIKFGELSENTQYTVNIPEIAQVVYQTIEKEAVNENFTGFDEGEIAINSDYGAIGANGLKYRSDGHSAVFEIKTTSGGMKYLSAKNTQLNKNLMVGSEIGEKLIDATIVSKMKLKISGTQNYTSAVKLGSMYGNQFSGASRTDLVDFIDVSSAFTPDSDGFYNTVSVASKTGTTIDSNSKAAGTYSLKFCDLLSDKTYENSEAYAHGTVSNSTLHNSAAFKMYQTTDAKLAYTADLAYYKAGLYTLPEVLKNNGYDSKSRTISYVMNTDIDEETLVNIRFDSQAIAADYDSLTRTVTLTPSFPLGTAEHTVSFNGVSSADGFSMKYTDKVSPTVKVTEVAIKAADGSEITNIYNTSNIKYELNYENYGNEKINKAIIAVYNGNRLIDVKMEDITFDKDSSGIKTVDYNGIIPTAGLKVCAMLWDSDNLMPLCPVAEKSVPQSILIEAESFDSELSSGIDATAWGNTGTGGWATGDYAVYKNVSMTPIHTKFTAHLLPWKAGTIEIRANAIDGTLLGALEITSEMVSSHKNDPDFWTNKDYLIDVTTTLTGMTGVCDLYIIATNNINGCSTDWYKIEIEDSGND